MIQVKNPEVLRSLLVRPFHPTLIEIMEYIADKYGCIITQGYREKRHANDLHGVTPLVRAIDIRSWCYPDTLAQAIKDDINIRWLYDPDRPNKRCLVWHDSGKGIHFHVQVHPKTEKSNVRS